MPSPPSQRDHFWKRPHETAWRAVASQPPPDPSEETEIQWLTQKWGETPSAYQRRAQLAALPTYQAPARP